MKEWAPGLSVLERGWLSSNNVVLRDFEYDVAAVVDTGHVRHANQTVALVEQAVGGHVLQYIFNTHLHSDHCGGNAALAERFGAEILIPPGDFNAALNWDERALSFHETGQGCVRFTPNGRLMPGARLPAPFDGWEVHAAPGHDPASVILFNSASRVLISADALWENGFGIVFPILYGEDAFVEVEATLTVIEQLRPGVVIPGHGTPFTDVTSALGRARARLEYFRRQPRRHAVHAGKALVVFHLLEAGAETREALLEWGLRTPVMRRIAEAAESSPRIGPPGSGVGALMNRVVDELVAARSIYVHRTADGREVLRAFQA